MEILDEHLDYVRGCTAILRRLNLECTISQNLYFECAKFQDRVMTHAIVDFQGKIKRANSFV